MVWVNFKRGTEMSNLFNRLIYVCAVFLMLIPLVSCSGGGSDTSGGTTGFLSLGLTDNPGDYLNVFVTIDKVQVKQDLDDGESGWIMAYDFDPDLTVDLLELRNGQIKDLGLAELPIGQYGQLRLFLGELETDENGVIVSEHPYPNYVVVEGDTEEQIDIEPLKVPSGYQTGIKILHGFTITAGVAADATKIILDFDAKNSVVEANGNSGWHLKPTIKGLETVDNSIGDNAIAGSEGGVDVNAQIYTPEPAEPTDPPWDPMDEVTVEGTAESDDDGYYKIFLPPNTYNVVATKDGFIPECLEVQAEFFEDLKDVDFALEAEPETITISGVVSGLATDTDTAQLSIRQLDVACVGGATNVTIEVASDRPVNGDYSITVPAGIYDLVATDGTTTLELEGLNADTTGQNLDFTP
jgi:hypothetical protein